LDSLTIRKSTLLTPMNEAKKRTPLVYQGVEVISNDLKEAVDKYNAIIRGTSFPRSKLSRVRNGL